MISLLLGRAFSTGRAGFSPALCQLLLLDLSAADVCRCPKRGGIRWACSQAQWTPGLSPQWSSWVSPLSLLASSSPSQYADPNYARRDFFLFSFFPTLHGLGQFLLFLDSLVYSAENSLGTA